MDRERTFTNARDLAIADLGQQLFEARRENVELRRENAELRAESAAGSDGYRSIALVALAHAHAMAEGGGRMSAEWPDAITELGREAIMTAEYEPSPDGKIRWFVS